MKKIILLINFLVFSLTVDAQLTLEHTYYKNRGVSVINIEDEGQKYIMIDTPSKELYLYNDDHSIWKKIKMPVPAGYTFYGYHWIAKKFIDLDNKLELAYSFYKVSSPTVFYTSKIIKEDGTELYSFDDVAYTSPTRVNGKWKLLVPDFDSYFTEVYSVLGSIPYLKAPDVISGSDAETVFYPNPMEYAATLRYNLPAGTSSATLFVYDMQGKEVRSYSVTDQFTEILVNRSDLPAGMYTYKLQSESKVLSVEKFVIK